MCLISSSAVLERDGIKQMGWKQAERKSSSLWDKSELI